MPRIRNALLAALVCLIALGSLAATGLAGDLVATTGNATSVASRQATLNGVVDPTFSDSIWFFEYSTRSDFSTGNVVTPAQPVGAGLHVVSVTVKRLAPGTTYFFRTVVTNQADTTLGRVYHAGSTMGFTTRTAVRYGRGALAGRSFGLTEGRVALPLTCTGARGSLCTAAVGLLATPAHGHAVLCGHGWYLSSAPHRHTVRVLPTAACLALVAHAPHHRLPVTFLAVWATHQTRLRQTVTLTG